MWLDTAGFGDNTVLSEERIKKTLKVMDRADIAVLVSAGDETVETDAQILAELRNRKIPVIRVLNKADIYNYGTAEGIRVNSLDESSRDKVIYEFKDALIKICPEEFINTPTIFGDLVSENG